MKGDKLKKMIGLMHGGGKKPPMPPMGPPQGMPFMNGGK